MATESWLDLINKYTSEIANELSDVATTDDLNEIKDQLGSTLRFIELMIIRLRAIQSNNDETIGSTTFGGQLHQMPLPALTHLRTCYLAALTNYDRRFIIVGEHRLNIERKVEAIENKIHEKGGERDDK